MKLTDKQKDRVRRLADRLKKLVELDAPVSIIDNELPILRSILYPFGHCEACGRPNLEAGNCSREQCHVTTTDPAPGRGTTQGDDCDGSRTPS